MAATISTANFRPGVYEVRFRDGTTQRITVTAQRLQDAVDLYKNWRTRTIPSGSKPYALRWVSN